MTTLLDGRELARPQLDDLDRALVARLRTDGRESNRSLAAALNVNEVTVAGRLRRLEEAGIVRVVAVTDIRLFGHREFAFAMARVRERPLFEVAAEIAKMPEAVTVSICAGRYDLIVPLLGRDRSHLVDLFADALPRISGIDVIVGSMALDVVKYDSRWALLSADPGTVPQTLPSETVDEIDLEVIRMLQVNARRSNRNIAMELGVSEGTVRGRIRRMLDERVFRIQAVSDILAFGIGAHAFIGVTATPGMADQVAATLAQRDDVAQLTRVLGEFELLAVLIASDHEALIKAIVGEISVLPGVRQTETFETCTTMKHTYTWTWVV